jgi:hypothetical protein
MLVPGSTDEVREGSTTEVAQTQRHVGLDLKSGLITDIVGFQFGATSTTIR